jgi:hypothetical protein
VYHFGGAGLEFSPAPVFFGGKAMDVEYKVLFGFLLVWAILFTCIRFIAPRRRLRRFREQMASWNWREQSVDQISGWQNFEKAAVEGIFGQDRQTVYEREIGFLKEQVERQETRSAVLRTPVFSIFGNYPRLAVCVTSRREVKKRTRILLPFWGPAEKTGGTVDQLWFGEVRSFPVRKHIQLYSWLNRFGGDYLIENTARKDFLFDRISRLDSSPKEILDSELLHQVFQRHRQTLDTVMPEIILAPGAWVLTASLARAVNHLAAIAFLSIELSKALGTLSRQLIRDTGKA